MNYYNGIGSFEATVDGASAPAQFTIIQSLWTKPITSRARLKQTLFIAALSLAYAHRSGYKVHMHTDSFGAKLMKKFGYDKLCTTLDAIPPSVPTELFAAGKFYAMRAEGAIGKVHIDIDVFLKKTGILDCFYKNHRVDLICQQEEDIAIANHADKIKHMLVMGHPAATRPDWRGSINTGIVGFWHPALAARYMNNYFEALKIYTAEKFQAYKQQNPDACLLFDFILEQVNLSYMSIGYDVRTLVPTDNPTWVADKIGYQHLQGSDKWTPKTQHTIRLLLAQLNNKLYHAVPPLIPNPD